MWHSIIPAKPGSMAEFEKAFDFRLDSDIRQFWQDHNGGIAVGSSFPTTVRERSVYRFLDVADRHSQQGAWAVNIRMRHILTESRIVFGCDTVGNLLCVEKTRGKQVIVVWNHLHAAFESCLLDIPGFLKAVS